MYRYRCSGIECSWPAVVSHCVQRKRADGVMGCVSMCLRTWIPMGTFSEHKFAKCVGNGLITIEREATYHPPNYSHVSKWRASGSMSFAVLVYEAFALLMNFSSNYYTSLRARPEKSSRKIPCLFPKESASAIIFV